jgi:hypothetical protein
VTPAEIGRRLIQRTTTGGVTGLDLGCFAGGRASGRGPSGKSTRYRDAAGGPLHGAGGFGNGDVVGLVLGLGREGQEASDVTFTSAPSLPAWLSRGEHLVVVLARQRAAPCASPSRHRMR